MQLGKDSDKVRIQDREEHTATLGYRSAVTVEIERCFPNGSFELASYLLDKDAVAELAQFTARLAETKGHLFMRERPQAGHPR